MLGAINMAFKDEHAVETFKSLISISTEAFKALQLLNGGAVVALLAYLGQMVPTAPHLAAQAALPMALFIGGLVAGTLVYATSYLTQLALHNENIGNTQYKGGKHELWLWVSLVLSLVSMGLFAGGAFACLAVLAP